MLTYTKRNNLFEKGEREWRVTEEAILCRDPQGGEQSIPWRDIESVRLAYAPTRFKTWRHAMVLKFRNGLSWTIDNVHFKGIGDFEDRSAAYTPFVREVIAHIRAKAPQARARVGSTPIAYWISVISLTLMFSVLAMLLIAVPIVEFPGVVWVKLLIIAFFLPTLFLWAKRAFPRSASLDALPEDALPRVA